MNPCILLATMQNQRHPVAPGQNPVVPVRCVAPGSFAGPVLVLDYSDLDPSVLDGRSVIMVPTLHTDYASWQHGLSA